MMPLPAFLIDEEGKEKFRNWVRVTKQACAIPSCLDLGLWSSPLYRTITYMRLSFLITLYSVFHEMLICKINKKSTIKKEIILAFLSPILAHSGPLQIWSFLHRANSFSTSSRAGLNVIIKWKSNQNICWKQSTGRTSCIKSSQVPPFRLPSWDSSLCISLSSKAKGPRVLCVQEAVSPPFACTYFSPLSRCGFPPASAYWGADHPWKPGSASIFRKLSVDHTLPLSR